MSTIDVEVRTGRLVSRERQLQQLVTVYIVTGLLFMVLPGTFLGVWNLLSISAQHTVDSLSPAWLQAHGHAQIFGWLGTFILGIGFYSLSKMGNLQPFAISRGWLCFALWTGGVSLRWASNVTAWEWRWLLPLSAALELSGFLLFFFTVGKHRPVSGANAPRKREAWMIVVIASTVGFLTSLVVNFEVAIDIALHGQSPAVPMILDQRLLLLPTWGFLVPTVWGFNARWLPVFLGLRPPHAKPLYAAVLTAWAAVAAMLFGLVALSTALLPVAAVLAIAALGIFERPLQPAKLNGVHRSFPIFVRIAYVWLLIASVLSVIASLADRAGGIWGASRHALTVGFLVVMVFSIGPKILPAFCGARVLFSPKLMFLSLTLLNAGCLLRVCSEIQAYEGYARHAWSVLPVSAVIELTAVTVFAWNLVATLLRPPAHFVNTTLKADPLGAQ
jgi:uncharacterized protein involved in response to NO